MRKWLFIVSCFLGQEVLAQVPKYIGNYSLFQQYYNPALTAHDYSAVKMFYRNQWTGFEDAPRSIFLSGELDPSDLRAHKTKKEEKAALDPYSLRQLIGRHAVGLSLWHDSFGAFTETQVNINYSARASLTRTLALRAGVFVSYSANRLDTDKLNFEQASDPVYGGVTDGFYDAKRIDVGVGLALTHQHFYVGYAVKDILREGLYFGDDFLRKTISRKHVLQGGVRRPVSRDVTLIANGLLTYDKFQRESFDVQVKSLFIKTCWLGVGYRERQAYTATAGLIMHNVNICYLLELPTGLSSHMYRQTHEIALTFNLMPVGSNNRTGERSDIF